MALSTPSATIKSHVVRTDAVRRGIKDVRKQSFHQFFPAYLHLRQLAGRKGALTGLAPDWSSLGEYLRVAGAPRTHPFYRPFMPATWSEGRAWLNTNLAGSWAGSSLREGQPPLLVVQYDSDTQTFALREKHWELARQHLLDGRRVNIVPLAVFLYRDFAVESDRPPNADDLVAIFRKDFGYDSPSDNAEFEFLYDVTNVPDSNTWFEPFQAVESSHGS